MTELPTMTGPTGSGWTPAGAWETLVTRPSGTYPGVLHFTVDGRVFLASGGAGTWWATGEASFSFRVAEPVLDTAGGCVGWVDIVQRVHRDAGDRGAGRHGEEGPVDAEGRDGFSGTGTSVVHDARGRPHRSARISLSARRVTPEPEAR